MTNEKKHLTHEVLRAQSAVQLPHRHMMALLNVVVTNVLNNNTITIPIDISNINVIVNVCLLVKLINNQLFGGNTLTCSVTGLWERQFARPLVGEFSDRGLVSCQPVS